MSRLNPGTWLVVANCCVMPILVFLLGWKASINYTRSGWRGLLPHRRRKHD